MRLLVEHQPDLVRPPNIRLRLAGAAAVQPR